VELAEPPVEVAGERAFGSMEGHVVGSDEMNIRGETTFRWLPGGFFLEQHGQLDFMGLRSTAWS
jgi:hypothetical protein